jgi:DNA-binding CsgD family transcriptional regulator
MLVEGVVRLVAADTWIWSTAVIDGGDAMSTCVLHGGWITESESGRMFALLTNPSFHGIWAVMQHLALQNQVTLDRPLLTSKTDMSAFEEELNRAGFAHFLVSVYPLNVGMTSTIGLHRRLGKPAFTDRDRAIVHVVFSQIDWLHRHGSDVPAKDHVLDLSPRERQVMIFLLGGDSQKEVARRLQLSEHTVGDYVKHIYSKFSVSSRSELLAHFLAGGQR